MCYLDTYQCTIVCLNSKLNITSAMNGTIESAGWYAPACHVSACKFVEHSSDVGNPSSLIGFLMETITTNPVMWFALGLLIFGVIGVFAVIWYGGD